MSQPSANLQIAVTDSDVWIRIAGRASFSASVEFNRVVEELIAQGRRTFVFDLSECVTMDSTFLGVLAGIGLSLAEKNRNHEKACVALVNPNARVSDLLESLGIAPLFSICANSPARPDHFEAVAPAAAASKVEVSQLCLTAHETLMGVNSANVPKFKDVARFLAEDLARAKQAKS